MKCRSGFLQAWITTLVTMPMCLFSQFTTGNLTVLQAGDGTAALANTGNPIVLKEYSTNGTLTYSMAAPTSGTNALLISGSASSEGYLSLSADGRYLVFGGYVQSLPNSVNLPGATGSVVNRGIGLTGGLGLASYSLVSVSTSFFSTGNIRAATAADKNNVWAVGSSHGTCYFGLAAPAAVQNGKTNLRAAAIFNGQLYCSAQVATGTPTDIGIYAVGTGTPLNAGQTASCVIVTGAGSQPGQFFFNSSNTICYVADGRAIASSGGIQKWVYSAGTWSLAYTLNTGAASTTGAFGVVADFSGTNPKVYATTTPGNGNRLIAINDLGASSTASVIATAPSAFANFRGLAFSPCSLPNVSLSSNGPICDYQSLDLHSVGTSGSNTYTWSGAGNITSAFSSSTSVLNAASGVYTLSVENSCGVSTETIAVLVNPSPAVQINSLTVCTGQSATLHAAGAATYSWSTGALGTSVTVTPLVNTSYTVIAASAAGCVGIGTTQVLVATTPTLTVNSSTICTGSQATLITNGVNTFTWSNGANTNSIVVSPATNTSYTVSGSLTGCVGTPTGVSNVIVNPSPTINLTGSSVTCPGVPVSLTVTGADTYSWNFGSTAAQVTVSPTITTSYTVVGFAANGCSHSLVKTISTTGGPPLLISSTSSALCLGQTATLSVSGASGYTWSTGGTGSIIAVTPTSTAIYTASGSIGTCKGNLAFTQIVDPCETLAETNREESFLIFPNPANEEVALRFKEEEFRRIDISNELGQVVFSYVSSDKYCRLPLQAFANGLYFIRVSQNNKSTVTKLLVEQQ